MQKYDVIVIGGGHAGCEAAGASARLGAKTLLITPSYKTIGEMSCNPAIGGLGKGHLVREIDALDGLMGRVADLAGIQFRMLNKSKGPAVQGPRAQSDRLLYKTAMQAALTQQKNLQILENKVADLMLSKGAVSGVILSTGEQISAAAVILTTGTFLNGLIHIGSQKIPAGRLGEKPSIALADRLYDMGFSMGRLKTGTPPRLDGKTIDWDVLVEQPGDENPVPFSSLTDEIVNKQVCCHITQTNEKTHKIITDNLHRAPIYNEQIESKGPRYCPSIEDKVVRFKDRSSHQIFLEPESLDNDVIYPNGISTSLPEEVQCSYVHSIKGLGKAVLLQPGYAIEYDYIDPRELYPTLENRTIRNLFCAGQINGTTGYEEAAGQGLIAGLNAALKAGQYGADRSGQELLLSRADAYLGVMIDDLVSKSLTEPYRMFTSRAEYRLRLRADNADQRLTPLGLSIGCVGSQREAWFLQRSRSLEEAGQMLQRLKMTSSQALKAGLAINQDGRDRTALELLSYPDIDWQRLAIIWPEMSDISLPVQKSLEVDARYSVYLQRQERDIKKYNKEQNLKFPRDFCFSSVGGLSNEIRQKLQEYKPMTIAQAAKIDGMTPAAIIILIGHIEKHKGMVSVLPS